MQLASVYDWQIQYTSCTLACSRVADWQAEHLDRSDCNFDRAATLWQSHAYFPYPTHGGAHTDTISYTHTVAQKQDGGAPVSGWWATAWLSAGGWHRQSSRAAQSKANRSCRKKWNELTQNNVRRGILTVRYPVLRLGIEYFTSVVKLLEMQSECQGWI